MTSRLRMLHILQIETTKFQASLKSDGGNEFQRVVGKNFGGWWRRENVVVGAWEWGEREWWWVGVSREK